MMEQSAVVQRALDALRAVCIAEPEPERIVCHNAPACHQSIPPSDPADSWLVNGKRETVFPRCPACRSFALYREHNIGPYECLSCTKQNIPEVVARSWKETVQ